MNLYLHWALLEMLEKQDYSRPGAIVYSQEAVGAAKVVLLAVRRMEFEKEKSRAALHKRRAVRGNQRYL